jgi:hypothetical protein
MGSYETIRFIIIIKRCVTAKEFLLLLFLTGFAIFASEQEDVTGDEANPRTLSYREILWLLVRWIAIFCH